MKSYRDYIIEKREKLMVMMPGFHYDEDDDSIFVDGLVNPSRGEVLGFLNRVPHGARFLFYDGRLLVWDAMKAIHAHVLEGEFRLGRGALNRLASSDRKFAYGHFHKHEGDLRVDLERPGSWVESLLRKNARTKTIVTKDTLVRAIDEFGSPLDESLNEETSYRRKGYINVNTGKMVLFPFTGKSIRPFHTEYVLKNANKFIRGGEDALLRKFADASGFEPEDEETISMWVDIKTGKVDRDPNLDSIIEAEGWRRVVFDEGISSVEPVDRREGQKLVKMILDKIPWKNIENLNVFDRGHLNDMTSIYSEEDAIQYAKTGRVAQRTSIGRTMAQFREEIDKAEFRAHWKKAPILTTGGGNVKQRNQFWDSYFKHFEDKYGPIPNRIKDAMRQADMKPNPSITHKGKKFSIRTGMDEMDLLYHVLSEGTIKGEHLIGWLDSKNKLHLYPQGGKMGIYHSQILTNLMSLKELRKFMPNRYGLSIAQDMMKFVKSGDMTEKQLKKLIDANYQSIYNQLKSGVMDSDWDTEENMLKSGWVKIRIDRKDRGSSALTGDPKRCHQAAKILDKELGGWQGISTHKFWIDSTTAIFDEKTWDTYIKTGRVPRQTEIGRNMSQFREDWSEKYKKSIDCNNPKGFSQRAHCQGRKKNEMLKYSEFREGTYAKSGLGKWMNQQSAGGGPGWDRYNEKGERVGKCGDAKEGEAYAACLSRQKADKLGKEKIADFVKRKRAAQKKAGDAKKGGEEKKGQKPTFVKTGVTDLKDEYIIEKNVPNDPALWKRAIAKAKSKFDVYPSAYANAWAAKWYKGEGGTWRVEEDCGCDCDEIIETVIIHEEDGKEKEVKLNDPFRTPGGPKKFAVYVKNDKGNVVLVRFGDPNLSIKRDQPERLKNFRARHGCDEDPGPKWKAKYWSCKFWEKDSPVSKLLSKGSVE